MSSPQIIVFAIQGAVKFGLQMRAAYVDSTHSRDLILPLPDFKPDNNPLAAVDFFLEGTVTEPKRLCELIDKIKQDGQLNEDEKKELLLYHHEYVLLDLCGKNACAKANDGSLVPWQSINALVSIRQWNRDPNPSALQRLSGSLIEIGIDYFVGPGAEKLTGRHAAALKALLTGLDGIEFAVEPLGDLPQKLLSITMETVSTYPQVFSDDADTQAIISTATRSLLSDVNAHIEALRKLGGANDLKEEKIRSWAEVAFHSLLSSTGTLMLKEPERFLGLAPGAKSELIQSVGNATLALVLDATDGTPTEVFTREALESISTAALRVVAQYPELATGNDKLKKLVSQLAADLSKIDGVIRSATLPDVMRLVLEHTAENLPLLWPQQSDDPKKHLAFAAAQTVLGILMRKPVAGDRWKLEFGRAEALAIVDTVLNDFLRNPGWLVQQAKLSPQLDVALQGILAVLRQRGDERLNGQLAMEIVLSGLNAAASRSEFLDKMTDGKPIVAAAIDTILAATIGPGVDPKVAWRTVREEVMLDLVDTALEKLAESKLDIAKIATLAAVVNAQVENIKAGDVWSVADFAIQLTLKLKT